ncbi:MAG: F0F1 ATP synthase subunit A [Flavobacteriaceae bacterium]
MKLTSFIKIATLSVILIFLISGTVYCQDHNEHKTAETHSKDTHKSSKDDAFDITSMIMHHISDSHEFHVYGKNEDHFPKALTVPLPIILWTKNGLVTFMSSEFHHNDDGTQIIEKKGLKFAKFHNKIYQVDNGVISLDEKHHPTNSKPLDFSITKNVFVLFLSVLLLLLGFGAAGRSYKKTGISAPKGIAKFLEPLVLFIRDEIAIPNIGEKHYRKYIPLLLTIFFFVWLNNIFGLIPFFPFAANVSGNIAFTLTLAVIVFIVVNLSGNKNYWKHIFWMPGVPVPMKIFLAPIEVIGMIVKPVSLMIRLFANITAGHIIVLSLIGLIFVLKTVWVAPVSVAFTLFISVIEILVTAIQAYIFTMLTSLYIGAAIEEEH